MDAILDFLKGLSIEEMLPDLAGYISTMKWICALLVLVGPLAVLILGLLYMKCPPKSVESRWGFSNIITRKSTEIWEKAHAIAGKLWTVVGGALLGVATICSILFIWQEVTKTVVIALWVLGIELVVILASWIVIMLQLRKE